MKARETALHRNPFFVLGATSRDDRRRIVELAEDKALTLDHDVCQKARSDLTNPRTRLSAEIAWLPGVSPRRAEQLAQRVLHEPMSIRVETGLPTLARANLLAAAFEVIDDKDDEDEVSAFILETALVVEDLDAEEILRDIREDRAVSGFPEIRSIEQVESELSERRRYFRTAIKEALDRLSTASIIRVMTNTVRTATAEGEIQAPALIDELVDSYEVETRHFLEEEAVGARKLIAAARESAGWGEYVVGPLLEKLEALVRNWQMVACPIQLSARARGLEQTPSVELAYSIRSLAVDLFNEHDLLPQSNQITNVLLDVFRQVPEIAEKLEQDAEAIEKIFQQRGRGDAHRSEVPPTPVPEQATASMCPTCNSLVAPGSARCSGCGGEMLPPGRLPNGNICRHDGEKGDYCTRCWMNLYEARKR